MKELKPGIWAMRLATMLELQCKSCGEVFAQGDIAVTAIRSTGEVLFLGHAKQVPCAACGTHNTTVHFFPSLLAGQQHMSTMQERIKMRTMLLQDMLFLCVNQQVPFHSSQTLQ